MSRRWGRRRRQDWGPQPASREAAPTPPGRHYSLTLATVPASIPLARRTTQMCFTTRGVPRNAAVLDAALLIVTELVTNCVRHAAERSPHTELILGLGDDGLEVAVADEHPWVPSVPADGGLHVIADLVRDFGGRLIITPAPGGPGKTIRVLLPLPAVPTP